MEEDTKNNLYQCKECGLHYKNNLTSLITGKELAEKCEAWCKEHKTCNMEITKNAEENLNSSPFTNSYELVNGEKNNLEDVDPKENDKVKEIEKKCNEYLNNWKRSEADFINYKKDEMERAGALVKYAKENMILNLLPIIDSIYLSEKYSHILENVRMSEWLKGFGQIKKQITEFLKREGIEEIKAVGEKFNPEIMEVIEQIEGNEPDMVVEELQKGYVMDEKVIRPAKVKISK